MRRVFWMHGPNWLLCARPFISSPRLVCIPSISTPWCTVQYSSQLARSRSPLSFFLSLFSHTAATLSFFLPSSPSFVTALFFQFTQQSSTSTFATNSQRGPGHDHPSPPRPHSNSYSILLHPRSHSLPNIQPISSPATPQPSASASSTYLIPFTASITITVPNRRLSPPDTSSLPPLRQSPPPYPQTNSLRFLYGLQKRSRRRPRFPTLALLKRCSPRPIPAPPLLVHRHGHYNLDHSPRGSNCRRPWYRTFGSTRPIQSTRAHGLPTNPPFL